MVTFGVITVRVDLVSAQQSKATKAKSNISTTNLCPACKGDRPLQSQLWCEDGHGPFKADNSRKAVTVNGELKATTAEAVTEAKVSTVKEKTADLSVFPAEQVEAATLPSGNMFRLRSEPTNTYGVLLSLVADRSHAFVCEMVVKGKACLYRAIAQNGTIVLVELVRPERMHPVDATVHTVDSRVVEGAQRLVEAFLEDFVPGDWADERQARLKELGDAEPEVLAQSTDVKAASNELLAMLKAAPAA